MGNNRNLALRVALNSVAVILIAFTIVQTTNYVRDGLLLHAGTLVTFILSYAGYMGTRVLPVMVVFAVILFLSALPIQKVATRSMK